MERWKINLYTIWFSQVISLMSFGFGTPFLPFYIQQMGVVEPDRIKFYSGLLSAAPAITMAIMAPVWGLVADKWGKKLMLLRAMFFAAFIITGMGLAFRVEHLVLLRFLQGVFTGTITASSALIAAGTPDNRLSYALGFLSSSTFIGISAGPVIGGIFAEYFGYRPSFYLGGIMMFADFLLVLFLVREHKGTALEEPAAKQGIRASMLSVFTPLVVTMLGILLFVRIARSVFSPYIPLYIQEIRDTLEGSSRITGLVNGFTGFMTAISGLTLSRLGDKCNRMLLLKVLIGCSILVSLPLMLVNNIWLFALLYGMVFFVLGGVEPVIMSETTGTIPSERRGILFGVQATVGSTGLAVSPMLGSLVSIHLSLKAIFLLIPVFLLLGLTILFLQDRLAKGRADASTNSAEG